MKKFSKVLVILMTLAMLLGVVVISASATDNAIDYQVGDGEVITTYATLADAIAAANENTEVGDITISVKAEQTLSAAVTITRDATKYGKVIIKLNGNTLNLTATGRYDDWARVSGSAIEDTVFVKASADADPVEYFMSSKKGGALVVTGADSTVYSVANSNLVAGETYVGTVSAAQQTANVVKKCAGSTAAYLHQVTVGAGANLVVEGDGTITGATGADMFAIEQGTDADLTVKNVIISKSKSTGHESIADIQGGRATFDGICVNPYNVGSAFWQGDSAEITIKNSLIISKNTSNDYSLIHTETTNTKPAADGYHIEVYNSTIITHANLIGGGGTSTNSSPNANDGSPNGTRHYDENSIRLGLTYVNTAAKFENCNIEVVNYDNTASGAHMRSSALVYGIHCNVDFTKSNIFVAQRAFGYNGNNTKATYNFIDSYIEFTGKGNLEGAATNGAVQFAADSRTINLYNTEVRLGANYAAGKNPNGTDITAETFYNGVAYFGTGCVLDVALDDTLLKKVPSGVKTYTKDGVTMIGSLVSVDYTSDDITAGTNGQNPLVVMSKTKQLIGAGGSTGLGWFFSCTQGGYVPLEDSTGNKYVAFDSTIVYNNMSTYKYVPVADDASIAELVDGATGAWKLKEADADYAYVNTNEDEKAEYVKIGEEWVEIPEKYDQIYHASNTLYIQNNDRDLTTGLYEYLSYSFDIKNADGTDVFYPFYCGVQGRNDAKSNTVKQVITVNYDGTLSVDGKSMQLPFDEWTSIDVIVEIIEEEVEEGTGYTKDNKTFANTTYANSIVYVFVNGELFNSYNWFDQNTFHIMSGIRGNDWVVDDENGNEVLVGDALAKGAKLCFDNVRAAEFYKGYKNTADLKAVLAGKKALASFDYTDDETIPAKLTAENAAASVTIHAPLVDSSAWSTTNKILQDKEAGAYASVFYTATVQDAVRLGAHSTVNLVKDAEGVIAIDTPTTVKTNNKNFKWTSPTYYNSSETEGTLTFVPATGENLITVIWGTANGKYNFGIQYYGKGSTLVPLAGEDIVINDLTFAKFIYDAASASDVIVTEDMNITSHKLLPAFKVTDSLVLETNLVHKIRIYKDANGADILDYITKISLGGTVYYDKANSVNNLEIGATAGGAEYYYITVDVKSNEIAKAYDLEVEYKDEEKNEISASQSFSVVNYLNRAFATCQEGSALYNLLAGVVKYGAAAYAYFDGSDADEKAIVDALAAKYNVEIEVPTAAAGAAGANFDVEFVLNEKVEYRFYIVGIDADKMESSNVALTYTNYLGDEITVNAMQIETADDKYWVDLDLPAYEICGNVKLTLFNNEAGVDTTITYSIANYYADAKAASSDAKLLTLVEGLYAYTSAAKAYVEAK